MEDDFELESPIMAVPLFPGEVVVARPKICMGRVKNGRLQGWDNDSENMVFLFIYKQSSRSPEQRREVFGLLLLLKE